MGEKNLELTTSELRCKAAFEKLRKQLGDEPSYRAVARELGVQVYAVYYTMGKIREKGYLPPAKRKPSGASTATNLKAASAAARKKKAG